MVFALNANDSQNVRAKQGVRANVRAHVRAQNRATDRINIDVRAVRALFVV